ncbi:MAG TPA: hypothetical protein PKW33_02970 [Anaerolineaceae bacterium]|nr:hypothetical protein [Anaerolineaceae bacterium]HPN50523.1 hypothetical protein [Anaerolineaceae bacterium]
MTKRFFIAILLIAVLLTACNSTPTQTQVAPPAPTQAPVSPAPTQAPAGNTSPTAYPPAQPDLPAPTTAPMAYPAPDPSLPYVIAGRDALAKALSLNPDTVKAIAFEAVNWNDACLGVANAGEVCAAVITPGFRLTFEASGMRYEVRTNDTGEIVRVIK